jgi:hypothetical protein
MAEPVQVLAWDLVVLALVAPDLVLELVESDLVESVRDLALSQFDMSSSCLPCKGYLRHFHTPCRRNFANQRRDNRGSEHRKDSNDLGFLAPCVVHLALARGFWGTPCRVQTAALDVEHGPLFLL